VRGEDELGRHLVEFHQLAQDEWVVLAVDGARLQRRIDLGERDRGGVDADRLAQELPELAGGMRSLMPARSAGVRICLSGLRLTCRARSRPA